MAMKGTVGVIGAGVMGRGLSQDLARHGYQVLLMDIEQAILDDAKSSIRNSIRGEKLRGTWTGPSVDELLSRIDVTCDLESFGEVDFVIENSTEKWEIKKTIYPVIDRVCRSEVCFAVNTSAISITRIGGLTSRPDRVLGTHFMNPVPMKNTVEMIRGFHTSDATLDAAKALLSGFGKDAVVVQDEPGFVSNRVLMLTINEAIFLVQDRVATPGDIDKIFRECFGHAMGPLATADLIGLDTILYSIEVLYDAFNDSKYRPCPLLKKMVSAGLHGCKNGQGFFSY